MIQSIIEWYECDKILPEMEGLYLVCGSWQEQEVKVWIDHWCGDIWEFHPSDLVVLWRQLPDMRFLAATAWE